ncbi:MAG: PilT/PilU family type 4a pilus ATPase [Candidatus Omnitrophica bacterium]|nr:PilT/PilU family type 4a pilus ATPase [Candidatus Omnitrophota bacterium]
MLEKRSAERFRFRNYIQYERIMDDGSYSLPVTVQALDLSSRGISFYSDERMGLQSRLRIIVNIAEKNKAQFLGQVTRMEISEELPNRFLIGAKIVNIDEVSKTKVDEFISKINIYRVLDMIDLSNVVDVHFVAGHPPILKKIGKMEVAQMEPLEPLILRDLLLNILDEDRYRKFNEEKEANFVFFYKENIRFRVNLHLQQGKVEGVFRVIPTEVRLPTHLGLPVAVEKLMENKKGLILVAGRTGSGKTTTVASMVDFINNKRKAIVICIEKPIEYIHTNKKCFIKQREVGRDTLSFSNAAKNALRQNPDVLLIGEILDRETMEVAITAAETGMLVLTTMHAPDSSQALDRIVSFFPAELQKHMLTRLSLILKGIITQDLVPRRDETGLVVAAEILIANDALRRVMRDGDWKQIPTIIQTGKQIGMQSMRASLEQYFLQGIIAGEYFREYI